MWLLSQIVYSDYKWCPGDLVTRRIVAIVSRPRTDVSLSNEVRNILKNRKDCNYILGSQTPRPYFSSSFLLNNVFFRREISLIGVCWKLYLVHGTPCTGICCCFCTSMIEQKCRKRRTQRWSDIPHLGNLVAGSAWNSSDKRSVLRYDIIPNTAINC